MPREFSLFKYTSAKEMKKQQEQYTKKMFVFGEERQKEAEFILMQSLINKKLSRQEIIYSLLCAKQALMQEDEQDMKGDLVFWYKGNASAGLTKDEKICFITAAKLIIMAENFDCFPTKQQVIQNMEIVKGEFDFLIKK